MSYRARVLEVSSGRGQSTSPTRSACSFTNASVFVKEGSAAASTRLYVTGTLAYDRIDGLQVSGGRHLPGEQDRKRDQRRRRHAVAANKFAFTAANVCQVADP